ncbi:hypothetical protein OJF2_39300 [Aquisphaera giovannonii]|uniref:Uncharacterized protein n=1 Tax=Aquisphaera giovannonii TaxID=406548 RepID=A0A5B9W465_9BACT|nr:hypothetical protein [Aquisphaera giovannonii]QEH35378.1 hypothetical protein OJF2_39300 [Aquisphaera giovannonii]
MSKKPPPGMIGEPPSARGGRPADPGLHAQQIAREWEDVGESYVHRREKELGIPDGMNGQPDFDGDGRWRSFHPHGRQGGENTTEVVDSGVLNPDLLKGRKGGRLWAKATLRDRIDAAISHEYEELLAGGDHKSAIRMAAKTKLPIAEMARRINKARAR